MPQHVVFEIDADDLATNTASTLRTLADVRDLGFQLCISGLGGAVHRPRAHRRGRARTSCASIRCWSPASATTSPPVEVVQLLVRFAGRTGAQLIATGVRDARSSSSCCARNGVELFCGEAFARADTRLPQVTFPE